MVFPGEKHETQKRIMSETGNGSTFIPSKSLAALSLAAIGVVFGDIGTSPIYAIKESFHASYGLELNTDNVLGVISDLLGAHPGYIN